MKTISYAGRALKPKRTLLLIAALVLELSLAACGGGGGTTSSGQSDAAVATSAPLTTSNAPGSATSGASTGAASAAQADATPATTTDATRSASPAVLAADARFNLPQAIAVDSSGALYVADTGNDVVRKVVQGKVSTIAGSPGVAGTTDGVGSAARFSALHGITVGADQNVYVVDGNAVRKINVQTGAVSTVAGLAAEGGYADRLGAAALFLGPQGIAAEADGNLLVADGGNNAIRRVTPAGTVSTVLRDAQNFHLLHSVAVSGTTIYAGDENSLWRIDAGTQRLIGGAPNVYADVDGSSGIRFWPLQGLTADGAGNVYIAEAFAYPHGLPGLGVIRKMSSTDGMNWTASTVAGNPNLSGSADGVGGSALFTLSMGITRDAGGTLYVADSGNATIRAIAPDGTVTTVAGKAGAAGYN
ncbi:MAG: repeat containing protein [Herminiimonas sp.]|nr:repeat containing protein [Herminiimonas sp.]